MKPKRTLGIGLAVACALLASACAAGQQAATANEQNTQAGVNADLGMIHIRSMVVDPPTLPSYAKGADATVKVVIVNVGSKNDLLQSITSPVMADWGAFSTTAEADAVLAANAPTPSTAPPASAPASAVSASPAGSSAGSSDSSAASSASSSAPPSETSSAASPLPHPNQQVLIPAGGRVSWGTPEATGALVFLNFTRDVFGGSTIPVTLHFAQAGTITISVPIGLSGTVNTSPIATPTGIEG